MKVLIDGNKKQFKANLHCHTTLSDGHWSPDRIKEEYKKMGYSVVAITDHERLVSHFDLSDENIIFITAYEMYIRDLPFDHVNDRQAHINFYSETPTNKLLYYTPKITKYIPESERATLQYHKLVEEREYSVDFIRKTIPAENNTNHASSGVFCAPLGKSSWNEFVFYSAHFRQN
ncbi:MAG: PHP domain-containing protein [Clostridia bacterium]|nr:PHP domain-containing protein [Clostridia bacterium]